MRCIAGISGRSGSVLAVSLWILVILTMLAVSVGHRVSMGLRMARYQTDTVKAKYLARAAINRAIGEIEKDAVTSTCDTLKDTWADNPALFEKFMPEGNGDEYASVACLVDDGSGSTRIAYGASDEDRRIDLNNAGAGLLTELFAQCGSDRDSAKILADNVVKWRTSPVDPVTEREYEDNLGYACKGAPFTSVEELALVKGMADLSTERLEKVKAMLTVYGSGKININTASEEVLSALCAYGVSLIEGTEISPNDAAALVIDFRDFRNSGGYFEPAGINTDFIRTSLKLDDISSDNRTKIVDKLVTLQAFTAVSQNFRISASGNIRGVIKDVEITYDRSQHKILFLNEN